MQIQENQKSDLDTSVVRPVFVIGSGRSGTHWLGYSLDGHPEIHATVEEQPMFGLSTKMALYPDLEPQLFDSLVQVYKHQLSHSKAGLYLDKTHPNIWIADRLKQSFPQALFLGIERNPYATVASMLQHQGVLAWHARWREFPIPNRFLGITEVLARTYDSMPLASKCAIRWLAHHHKLNGLRETMKEDIKIIIYEQFACDTEKVVLDLQQFLNLRDPLPVPYVKTDSLTKWKQQLTSAQIRQIQDVVGFAPETM